MSKRMYNIKSSKKTSKQIVETIEKPQLYSGKEYGLNESLKGTGVKLAILDSGVPCHKDIYHIGSSVDVSVNGMQRDVQDRHGHSTMVSGIIGSNNPKSIVGIAPEAELYFAKVASGNGECSYNSLVAGVLWAIVQNVNIILISLGSQTEYSVLYDSLRKAHAQGISIIAASGDVFGQVDYPAKYNEALSVGKAFKARKLEASQFAPKLSVPNMTSYTTYLKDTYTKASGSSMGAALVSGLGCLVIEEIKSKKKKPTPQLVYDRLLSLKY